MPLDVTLNAENSKIKISFRLKNDENHENFAKILTSFYWDFLDSLDSNESVIYFIN